MEVNRVAYKGVLLFYNIKILKDKEYKYTLYILIQKPINKLPII
jgi:hypothetical protein